MKLCIILYLHMSTPLEKLRKALPNYEVTTHFDGSESIDSEDYDDAIIGRTIKGISLPYYSGGFMSYEWYDEHFDDIKYIHDNNAIIEELLELNGFEVVEYNGKEGWDNMFKNKNTIVIINIENVVIKENDKIIKTLVNRVASATRFPIAT